MRHADRPQSPCDVIIVLGAAVWSGGQPSPALSQRMCHAIRTLHAEQGKTLLVTGGLGKNPPAEARLMRQLALDAGVPSSRVFVEDQGASTLESAMRCRQIMRQHGWSTALIVTDRIHLRRSLLTFRRLGIHATGSSPPGVPYSRKPWKRWRYRVREKLAFAWYLIVLAGLQLRGHDTRRL